MKLPPLNALRAFEVAARHEGFIAAADELCVTRGAVSQQVRALEEHLGLALFRRNARGVELTEAGRRLQPILNEAFGRIAEATGRLTTDASVLRIICPPATSIRWLIPKLGRFREAHPEIRVRLTTDFYSERGFEPADFDLGFSCDQWSGLVQDIETRALFPVLLTPACAPGLLDGSAGLKLPTDLARFSLLHETAERSDWSAWLADFPIDGVQASSGDVFTNLDMATQAAVIGAGIVMGDLILCREEIRRGQLRLPFPDMVCASPLGSVCVMAQQDRWHERKIRTFVDWMHDAAQQDCRALGLD